VATGRAGALAGPVAPVVAQPERASRAPAVMKDMAAEVVFMAVPIQPRVARTVATEKTVPGSIY
jgi:hypothetical protein